MANTPPGALSRSTTRGEDGFTGVAPVAQYPAERLRALRRGRQRLGVGERLVPAGLLRAARRGGRRRAQSAGPADSFDPAEPGEQKRVHRGGSFLCTEQYCSRYMVGTRGKGEVDHRHEPPGLQAGEAGNTLSSFRFRGGVDHGPRHCLPVRDCLLHPVPGNVSLRDRLRRQLRRAEVDRLRRRGAVRPGAAGQRGLARALRGAAQRHGRPGVQARWTRIVPEVRRAQHLRAALEPRADPAVLAVAPDGRRRLAGGERRSARWRCGRCSRSAGWWCCRRTFLINHFDLFGLRQVWLYLRGRPYTALPFRRRGLYRLVRHPLYVGWLSRSGRRRR